MIELTEGTIFAIPLRSGGYAHGVVARLDRNGLVFAYFFGPQVSKPDPSSLDRNEVHSAVLCGQTGDGALKDGTWPVVGSVDNWSRDRWPMPAFVSKTDDPGLINLTVYDDDTLNTKSVTTVSVDQVELHKLPIDRVMGNGSVEIKLTKAFT